MGACGCADYHAEFQFPGPKGVIYAIGFYNACGYCQVPAGFTLYRHDVTDETARVYWEHLPLLVFRSYDDAGGTEGEYPLNLVDLSRLKKEMVPYLSLEGLTAEDLDDPDNIFGDVAFDEAAREVIPKALRETWREHCNDWKPGQSTETTEPNTPNNTDDQRHTEQGAPHGFGQAHVSQNGSGSQSTQEGDRDRSSVEPCERPETGTTKESE